MISSTSCGSFVAYTANESPTSKLRPHPVRSSSKCRVSFADSGPLRRRLTTMRAGNGFARVYRGAATATAVSACINKVTGLYADNLAVRKLISLLESSIISDCERRTSFHGSLCGGDFLRRFGLFKKVNGSFAAVVGDEIRRFFETETAQRAASIHIPLSGHVLRLFAQFVCHALK